MPVATMKKRSRPGRKSCAYSESVNLYRFIRLMLGEDISDMEIARRWGIDPKNFYCFKMGQYPVQRIEKLAELAKVLRINRHLVFEVALGAPAKKVFDLIKNNDLPGLALFFTLDC
ncbi:MAG: hypothetical protein AB1599_07670 [Planctomycetota bacterium]